MNTSVAFVAQVSAILMGFFTRVVFTRMLSEGYVGINGLFTDILNILSLSELGVGTAITYALYAPIAKGDIKKQQILMRMFRTFYRMTALFVMAAGLCLIPFLNILMKDRPDVDHLVLIYCLYLLNSVVSYLLIYKKNLDRCSSDELYYCTVSQWVPGVSGYLSDHYSDHNKKFCPVSERCRSVYDYRKCVHVQKSRCIVSISEGDLS